MRRLAFFRHSEIVFFSTHIINWKKTKYRYTNKPIYLYTILPNINFFLLTSLPSPLKSFNLAWTDNPRSGMMIWSETIWISCGVVKYSKDPLKFWPSWLRQRPYPPPTRDNFPALFLNPPLSPEKPLTLVRESIVLDWQENGKEERGEWPTVLEKRRGGNVWGLVQNSFKQKMAWNAFAAYGCEHAYPRLLWKSVLPPKKKNITTLHYWFRRLIFFECA